MGWITIRSLPKPLLARLAPLLCLCLALLPTLLFAWLGAHSRPYADDYGYLSNSLEVGAWRPMLFWREHWQGDFTNPLVYSLLAPLGRLGPAVFALLAALAFFALAQFRSVHNARLLNCGCLASRRCSF